MTPYLSLDRVSLSIGKSQVLRDVSFSFPLEGITFLRGRNGVGKTTLLRALLGLVPLQQGCIRLWGKTPAEIRGRIGMMPQRTDVAAPMIPVLSHVMAALDGTSWGFSLSPRRRQRAMALLRVVGADSLAHRPLGVLSGGERQCMALAQALAGDPSLLVLDEPLASLDSVARHNVLSVLERLNRQAGMAILMTVHERIGDEEALSPSREVWLKNGTLHAGI